MTNDTLDGDMALSSYDFEYPEAAVARTPAEPRDCARLLVLDRARGTVEHALFRDIGRRLSPGDCLVLNTTRVLPARLKARKTTGGKAELLLLRPLGPGRWSALSSRLRKGQELLLPGGFSAEVTGLSTEGEYLLDFDPPDTAPLLKEHGLAPLPPYILKARGPGEDERRDRADLERYQTVYAAQEGSIAAPTAGLHFTPGLLASLKKEGVRVAEIILHVGPGTFRPILSEEIRSHRMLPERYHVAAEASSLISDARREGRRVVAVGTTCTRVLETLAAGDSPLPEGAGETSLFIHPGHRFARVDALITNFHLPRSTPLLLASAFAGRERLLAAYREAVEKGYRLFSYGDSMLIT